MRGSLAPLVAAAVASACGGAPVPPPAAQGSGHAPTDLAAPSDFANVADPALRSKALFAEASRVFLHPRCVNCHPAGDGPTQRDGLEAHEPPVVRGPDDRGVPAMRCASCHQTSNLELARVPGAPEWRLAPAAMAWAGRSPAQICAQIKDPARNGGRTLAQVVTHVAHDELVAWGWAPGHDRRPAPGTQARFAALVQAWVDTGAECPSEVKP